MPLTPSHAAVAPLLRRMMRPFGFTVPMSALVVGTMTPDFSYLLRLAPGGGDWHTKVGVFEYCLPAGLAVWLIFRAYVGPALLRLMPPALGAAANGRVAPGPTYRLIPGAIVAIFAGVISHDVWDGFTHGAAWGARLFPVLHHRLHYGTTGIVRWYLILQYASSAIGLIVVVTILWRWVASQPKAARFVPVGERAWRVRDVGLLFLSGAVGAWLNSSRPHPWGLTWTLGYASVGAMSALAIALLAYGIIDSIRQRVASVASAMPASRCSEAQT
jgi:hypothetical protein